MSARRRVWHEIKDDVTCGQAIQKGNFTMVRVTTSYKGKPYWGVGFAKRNPRCDQWNELIGLQVARGRAEADLLDSIFDDPDYPWF